MDLPIGPTNLSSTAAVATNSQPLHHHHHHNLHHQDSHTTTTRQQQQQQQIQQQQQAALNYNALIANNLPLHRLLLSQQTTSECGLAFAAAVLAFQQSQLQQAHLQHHQRQQPPASHLPAVNLSTGPAPPVPLPQQTTAPVQQQPPPPTSTTTTQPPSHQQSPPSTNFSAAAQQPTAQTRIAQAAAVAAAAVAPLQAYQNPAPYYIPPLQQQQQHGSVNQQTPNQQPPVPQQQQQQQHPQTQQQQPQTTPIATATVPQISPFFPIPHLDPANYNILGQHGEHAPMFHLLSAWLQSSLRQDPNHTHHHHHTPYHYHHHLHGSHHHHHHHYGTHGQNNGQDDGLMINDSKPRGLNRQEIDSLPITFPMNEKDSRTCVICLSRFEPKSKVRSLSCNHAFHAKCVDKWLRANRTCPICRRDALLKCHVPKIKRI